MINVTDLKIILDGLTNVYSEDTPFIMLDNENKEICLYVPVGALMINKYDDSNKNIGFVTKFHLIDYYECANNEEIILNMNKIIKEAIIENIKRNNLKLN